MSASSTFAAVEDEPAELPDLVDAGSVPLRHKLDVAADRCPGEPVEVFQGAA